MQVYETEREKVCSDSIETFFMQKIYLHTLLFVYNS